MLAQHLADRVLRDRRLVIQQPVLGALTRHEVASRNRDLLVVGIAVEVEDLEAVVQRVGDLVGHVGRGDEQHLREIDLDVEVVVAERRVLRGVKYLEERRRRVATEVGAELVDLVEQDHGVHRSGIAQGPHEAARHRADIGAAMAADFGLVANATERDAHELATEGVRDRLAKRRLADAGRSDQREDHAALAVFDVALLAELAHGEVLDDALLDVVEAGVVGVEDRAGSLDVARLLAVLAPRQLEQRVEVRADGRRLGALRAGLEAIEFARRLLPGLVAQLRLVDLGAIAGELVALLALELAEFLADRIELAAQQELALRLLHALVDVLADALAHGDLGQHVAQPRGHLGEALGDVDRLEQLELALVGEVGREARSVGERAGLIDLAEHRDDTTVAARLEDLLDDAAVLAGQLLRCLVGLGVGPLGDLDAQGAASRFGTAELGAVERAQRDAAAAARQHRGLTFEDGNHADASEAPVDARDKHDLAVIANLVNGGIGLRRGEIDAERHAGEDEGVLQRDQG